jgi:DedD protein
MPSLPLLQRLSRVFSRSTVQPTQAERSPADAQTQARLSARRRLIGAAALVLVGVIVFPLLFETQPRPIPPDVALLMKVAEQRGGAQPPLLAAQESPVPSSASAEQEAAFAQDVKPADTSNADPSTPVAPPGKKANAAAPGSVASAPSAPVINAAVAPGVKAAIEPTRPSGIASAVAPGANTARDGSGMTVPSRPPPEAIKPKDGDRAIALLEGRAEAVAVPTAPATLRYVVQIGAFGDAAMAGQVRQKVERAGLKTYTHVIDTPAGKRIRVRVGPMVQREEAERVLAKLKTLGLGGSILSL